MSWVARGSLLIPKPPVEEDLKGGVVVNMEAIQTRSVKELKQILHVELVALEAEMMGEIKRVKKEAKRA